MDEILERFGEVFRHEDGPKDDTPYFESLYKNWGKQGNQEERRKEILEVQKSNRNNKLDKFRGILELVNAVEVKDLFQSERRSYYRPKIYVAGFNKTSPTYSNVLMLSEWMIEKPHDFEENWYVVPCPKGVRILLVAIQGTTKCYTKFGHLKFEVQTKLPGGHRPHRSSQCCVLDCFYNEKSNTMYILDLLAWNSQPMTDGETEFRHYWLQTQLEEISGLDTVTRKNEVIFKLLPKIPCDSESFQKFMMSFPPFVNNHPPMDGLLFYHRRAHYVSGQTPLVGWLYPYMVPEILGSHIEIIGAYAIQKPEGYVNQADFIEKFEAQQKKRKQRKSDSYAMDTADASNRESQSGRKGNRQMRNRSTSTSEISDTMEAEQTQEKTEVAEASGETETMEAEEVKPKDTETSPAKEEK